MIELGLARISRLLRDTPISWWAVHVAGTNGKGSVCAYTSAMLCAGKIRCGRFTSPHLLDRWDCITINDKVVSEGLFHKVEAMVKARDSTGNIKASEFELLTATAFEIFNHERIDVGVVEVGLGGRYDATNVFAAPAVTVITKVGEDHQALLGQTLEEIAYQKAGIMKRGTFCVVDGSNDSKVLDVVIRNAQDVEASPLIIVTEDMSQHDQVWSVLPRKAFEQHQQMNICLAFEATKEVVLKACPSIRVEELLPAVTGNVWQGRLQRLSIMSLTGRAEDILLDGAHNVQSAEALGSFVDRKLRKENFPVTWIVAVSKGKDARELLSSFLRPGDNLVAVRFGPVDGMPWISSQEAETVLMIGEDMGILGFKGIARTLRDALQLGVAVARSGPLVIAGSLYLVSDVLRCCRQSKHKHVVC